MPPWLSPAAQRLHQLSDRCLVPALRWCRQPCPKCCRHGHIRAVVSSHALRSPHRSFSASSAAVSHQSSLSPSPSLPSSRPPASSHRLTPAEQLEALATLPISRIRNFSIIAHIDHGKSTLADRLLEQCGNISPLSKQEAQHLDSLQVERERGITVKAQTASLFHRHTDGQLYLLNLIDTPGHVDFSYEVSRSLAACQGVLLLVDAAQGVQAQSLANHDAAVAAGLDVVPVVSKIDLPHADVSRVAEEMRAAFGIDTADVIPVSSKTGQNISAVLPAIIARIRPPEGRREEELRALLFDSWYDHHRGVVLLLRLMDGEVAKGDKIASYHSERQHEVQEVGLMLPHQRELPQLSAGQVGYVVAGIRSTSEARLGETIYRLAGKKHRGLVGQQQWQARRAEVQPLPGFKPAKAMVFAGIFPSSSYAFADLCSAVDKLMLSDASVHVDKERSDALGMGLRIGCLGLLHLDVFCSRLEQEFGASVLKTAPTLRYTAVMDDGSELSIESPSKFPSATERVAYYLEPMVVATIITPLSSQGALMTLCQEARGELLELLSLSSERVSLRYRLPMAELMHAMYDRVKSISSGFASLDYEADGSAEAQLVKLDLRLNGQSVDALSVICHREAAESLGRKMAVKLREEIDKQQFEVVIQACLGAKVLCRERVAPYRKDVLLRNGKVMGGGDVTRKRKLLDKQKEGKRRLKMIGNVELDESVFAAVMKL